MIVLYGAGVTGRFIARQLKEKGESVVFADNNKDKLLEEGIPVHLPETCRREYPDAVWVAAAQRPPYREEIEADIKRLGVKSIPLMEFLPSRSDYPPESAIRTILPLLGDHRSHAFFNDQLYFRKDTNHQQIPRDDIRNVYFEDFYTHLDNEHYVDCGAAEGDTVTEFISRWPKYSCVSAFEPDPMNFRKLFESYGKQADCYYAAVGDHARQVDFVATGDHTAHINKDGIGSTLLCRLDDQNNEIPPTLIKMDIEGYEKEALWGARNLIKEYSPVLAICAYHKGPDLWEIPLLIHALNPRYKLFFRRYLEATWELIYYAVPPERLK